MSSPGAASMAKARPAAGPWIESRAFDLACFILSPLAGLAVLLAYPVGGPQLAVAAAALIGGPHYLASYTFYFWDDAAEHHRRRWVVHFVVPVAIVVCVAGLVQLGIPAILSFIVYFWNAWHVARQSCGILSIYRIRGGCFNDWHKRIANAAIISVSLSMATWNLDWYPTLHDWLARVSPVLPQVLRITFAGSAAVSLAALAVSFYRRWREGTAPGLPETAFLATSLTLFHPYLWVRDPNLATLGMLMGHFIQYLAIVWLVNRRRFVHSPASPAARRLASIWRDPRLLFGLFVLGGTLFLLLQLNLMAVTITLVLLHFYLDGIFWAFRRAEVRRMLGPYLTGWRGSHDAAPAELPEPRPAA
jgi:hypothetical protein